MVIDMNETRLNTVAQLRAFLEGTLEVEFCALNNDTQRYEFIGTLLKRLRYAQLRRTDKGVVLRCLERTTRYSRQQLTRLVGRARAGIVLAKRERGGVCCRGSRSHPAAGVRVGAAAARSRLRLASFTSGGHTFASSWMTWQSRQ